MVNIPSAYKILLESSDWRRPLERHRGSLEENIKINLKGSALDSAG
jgi:hypothetical protein